LWPNDGCRTDGLQPHVLAVHAATALLPCFKDTTPGVVERRQLAGFPAVNAVKSITRLAPLQQSLVNRKRAE
jgi:hypothetical protein